LSVSGWPRIWAGDEEVRLPRDGLSGVATAGQHEIEVVRPRQRTNGRADRTGPRPTFPMHAVETAAETNTP
jgi:hypothetical protein